MRYSPSMGRVVEIVSAADAEIEALSARTAANLTQAELARGLSITRSAVARLAGGRSPFTRPTPRG